MKISLYEQAVRDYSRRLWEGRDHQEVEQELFYEWTVYVSLFCGMNDEEKYLEVHEIGSMAGLVIESTNISNLSDTFGITLDEWFEQHGTTLEQVVYDVCL